MENYFFKKYVKFLLIFWAKFQAEITISYLFSPNGMLFIYLIFPISINVNSKKGETLSLDGALYPIDRALYTL